MGYAMSRTDYRTLVDLGRKAGLGTSELYRALTARSPELHDHLSGQADGNGFIPGYASNGRPTYQPVVPRGREGDTRGPAFDPRTTVA